jgi:hypothetical protein
MQKRTFRRLALACCLLVALPPSWCCAVNRAACCDRAPQMEETPTDRPCCCAGKSGKCPCGPTRGPVRPCKSPCCERHPTITTKPDAPSADAAVLFTTQLVPVPRAARAIPDAGGADPVPLRRHVLLCVWLC